MISTALPTTAAASTTASIAGALVLIGIALLFVLLVRKEAAIASEPERMSRLGKALNLAIYPLIVSFILLVIVKVAQVLR